MLPWLILVIAVTGGLYLVARWWVQADPRQILKALRWAGAR